MLSAQGNPWRTDVEEIQQDATVCRYLFTAKLLYMFRTSIARPSSVVHKTVVAASGTEAATTVLCTTDDGRAMDVQNM